MSSDMQNHNRQSLNDSVSKSLCSLLPAQCESPLIRVENNLVCIVTSVMISINNYYRQKNTTRSPLPFEYSWSSVFSLSRLLVFEPLLTASLWTLLPVAPKIRVDSNSNKTTSKMKNHIRWRKHFFYTEYKSKSIELWETANN